MLPHTRTMLRQAFVLARRHCVPAAHRWMSTLEMRSTTLSTSRLVLTGGVACTFAAAWQSVTACKEAACKQEAAEVHRALDELPDRINVSAATLSDYQRIFREMGALGDSELTRTQLENFVARTANRQHVKAIASVLFAIFDQDGSGQISFSEFAAGLTLIKAARENMQEEAPKELAWRALDLDHSGYIERRELRAWVTVLQALQFHKHWQKRSVLGISSFDATGAFHRHISAEEITNTYMKQIDSNHDGKISKEEFFASGADLLDMGAVDQLVSIAAF